LLKIFERDPESIGDENFVKSTVPRIGRGRFSHRSSKEKLGQILSLAWVILEQISATKNLANPQNRRKLGKHRN